MRASTSDPFSVTACQPAVPAAGTDIAKVVPGGRRCGMHGCGGRENDYRGRPKTILDGGGSARWPA